MPDPELEAFKREIDLRQYAAEMGYSLDRRESWRGSAVMRCGGDKVVIKVDGDGHYVYFSVRDDQDNGSIIDFVQKRKRLSLGEVRKELRRWAGQPAASLPLFSKLAPTPRDRRQVESAYLRMEPVTRHSYLADRGLSPALLESRRFAGRVRMDARGNAVFPHFDLEGLCGFELKNRGFTGFSPGGTKGLWVSHSGKDDRTAVFGESAIEALSYAALHPAQAVRYASIGGEVNPKQPGLIAAAVSRLGEGAEVIAAMNNDDAGGKLSAVVAEAVDGTGRKDLRFRIHVPEAVGADWNDVLQAASFPTARSFEAHS